MTHTYNITGMTCTGCQAKVQSLLSGVPEVTGVNINLAEGKADISMSRHVDTQTLQAALAPYPKYTLTEAQHHAPVPSFSLDDEDKRSFWETYKPVLLIFGYISLLSVLVSATFGIGWMAGMRIFMSGFFLVFSFFKMLDIAGFAESYAMYDLVAKKIRAWGYIYVFIELALGVAYAINFNPLITNIITLVVMSVSIIGVLQSVLNKRKIKCACLGAVFNLPMSTVTIIEDALMIAMSAVMLAML
ncbi:heavy-metal-associated domain-containing protein [Mucilaginibacter sp. AK015]|uniref:heavy-metal-associated domain-containing protein n=1 Tax=Mucilaginibacter sp. AK015 TaxID=2723072 RepID=UPI00160F4E19|nr:heavy metal-associated domain-containing protein [Mucilaginibacter sp. AK015]MBB5394367.1 copper chaperone CopZ [Mucilaginibacter sp. AK015]